ncbi:hypothetical protein M758_1G177800 [Ceratodon purpureus]|uniref:Uncharacterized protein n=1 Tax=Ceratodon purpureus TaxID=3225 RepID=A0A8T0J8I0_CERPU|nr:hypothetical protein KC19_1G180800 [Ceratodon purpureus]KAG0630434.1 hypothetical protein M758_1G177800 [Ceratodon purpureus]
MAARMPQDAPYLIGRIPSNTPPSPPPPPRRGSQALGSRLPRLSSQRRHSQIPTPGTYFSRPQPPIAPVIYSTTPSLARGQGRESHSQFSSHSFPPHLKEYIFLIAPGD